MMLRRCLVVTLLVGVACSQPEAAPAPESTPDTELKPRPEPARVPDVAAKAAAIAREIKARPGDAGAVVEAHGMNPTEFSDLMYEIAGDPELAEAYETARG